MSLWRRKLFALLLCTDVLCMESSCPRSRVTSKVAWCRTGQLSAPLREGNEKAVP